MIFVFLSKMVDFFLKNVIFGLFDKIFIMIIINLYIAKFMEIGPIFVFFVLLLSAALVLLKMPFVAERNKLALLLKIIVVVCMGFWICIYWLQGLEGINK